MGDRFIGWVLLTAYLGFYVFIIGGWILGIVKFVRCDFESPYKCEIVYGVGAITGFNTVLGWFNFGK